MDTDAIIGQRLFTDGSTRPVYRDAEGRQYDLDDAGCPVFGRCVPVEHDGADWRPSR